MGKESLAMTECVRIVEKLNLVVMTRTMNDVSFESETWNFMESTHEMSTLLFICFFSTNCSNFLGITFGIEEIYLMWSFLVNREA